MSVKLRIHVMLKPSVLDPQGAAIQSALAAMGFAGVSGVRQGKVFDLVMAGDDANAAREQADEMCRKLLSNSVIETYEIGEGEVVPD